MGSVSDDANDRNLGLFSDLEAPSINDGVVELTFKSSKQDGYPVWSENKSKLIQQYVRFFILVTKHGTYIDGFAGPQVEQYNDESWSAKRVLEIQPPWLRRFILCDMNPRQVEHLDKLVADRRALGDKRKIEIHRGDFNTVIEQVLVPGSIREKEATFCLLDQRTFECKWDTVRKIAEYKKTNTKIEQFYFLAVGWLGRSIAALKDDKKLREWWGRDDIELPRSTSHSVELARLFSHRFMRELGYASAAAWPIYERSDGGRGKVMYYMIHATDHEEAPKLMNRAYKAATLASQPMEHTQACFDGEGFDLGDIAKRYDANE
ncbi:MAG TPA: three-Cys-motif partner protein TcmP [Burkholderiaceae bacterium]|jgi:three-Cys-motif partner protein|nr:three-Cys-motif partner protein TcmP [Burkholderiaceae bacterium]